MSSRFASRARLLCAIQLLAAALLIAACGGSSSRSATAQGTQDAASQPGLAGAAKTGHDPVTGGVITHHPLPGTGGGQVNDENRGSANASGAAASEVGRAPGPRDPCTLVSRAEAQSILGRPMATPVEAPLGPTCIYRPVGASSTVTLTVGPSNFARVKPRLRNSTELKVGGQIAYCGDYGQATTFVPLAGGRILTVTAPCPVGVRFAGSAVPRLHA
jgi:hypothetical protein